MTRSGRAGLTRVLSAVFLLISMFFVYRSFYGMRIQVQAEEPQRKAVAA